MPTKIVPAIPPRITPAYEKPVPKEAWSDPGAPQTFLAPPPKPDVSSWVVRANSRLEPTWEENELRGGRLFSMAGASEPEVIELVTIFRKDWDVGVINENRSISLIFKPRRTTNIRR